MGVTTASSAPSDQPAAVPPVRRATALGSDVRIQIFGALFGLGTIHHELQFILEQTRIGALGDYMERWSRLRPTIGWSSDVGIALHLIDLVVGILLVVLPWRRALLLPLALSFSLTNLVSPERIPSHNSLMVASLAVVLLLAVAEAAERALRRGVSDTRTTDWYGWTLTGLTSLCVLTYAFAVFHKLNLAYLAPATSTAPPFVLLFAEPLGLPREAALSLLGYPAIYGTLLIEGSLPILLLRRWTRLAGCLVGALFHGAMMARGIMDFPTAILGFYPLFMGRDEARELLAGVRARPSLPRLLGTLALAGIGIATFTSSEYVRGLYVDSPTAVPLVVAAHSALSYATILLFAQVTTTLAAQALTTYRNMSSSRSRTSSVARPSAAS